MNLRSTNGTHWSNDLTAGVGSSHGVRLRGGSTGGVIEAVGDDTDVSLTIRGQGVGGVTIGNSSQSVSLGSGAGIKGAFSTTAAWAVAALSSGAYAEVTLASTTVGVAPGDIISVELGLPAVSTQTLHLIGFRTSTTASSALTLEIGNITSTAVGSTASGTARISWLDVT